MKRITHPAKNKWTKLDPAFNQAILIVFFFSLIKTALEVKARTTYEALTASGQVFVENVGSDDEDAGSARDKGQSERYGKKFLVFLGDQFVQLLSRMS